MLNRYLAGAAVSLIITAALIIFMHYLIEISEAATTESKPRMVLPLGRTIMDTPPQVDRAPPELARPLIDLPPLAPPTSPDGKFAFSGPKIRSAAPVIATRTSASLDAGNSALINIISAEPEYPLRASQKNLEGFVVVRFDVSETGSVENVMVLESSSVLFEKAAINAAYRARYKPQTFNGAPQPARGLQKRFLFRMDP